MPRVIAVLACPFVQMLDVSGPLDVFAEANRQSGKIEYALHIVGMSSRMIETSSGTRIGPTMTISEPLKKIDTLLIAGAPNIQTAPRLLTMLEWVRRVAPTSRRFGSICSGAFILAESGLMDGRRVTTHWAVADALQRDYPNIVVDADAIYRRDGPVCTSAGVTAGMDLALALVEEDLGRELAMRVAAQLVMYFQRPGGQLQFSRHGTAELAGRSVLQELQRWIAAHPRNDLSVTALAAHAGMSRRHFARIFRQEVGTTPADYVEDARVESARRLLEAGKQAPKRVAERCGFSDVATMRRAFMRKLGITPAEYRRRFQVIAI